MARDDDLLKVSAVLGGHLFVRQVYILSGHSAIANFCKNCMIDCT